MTWSAQTTNSQLSAADSCGQVKLCQDQPHIHQYLAEVACQHERHLIPGDDACRQEKACSSSGWKRPQATILPGGSNAKDGEENCRGCHRQDPHEVEFLGLVGEVQNAPSPLWLRLQKYCVLHQAEKYRRPKNHRDQPCTSTWGCGQRWGNETSMPPIVEVHEHVWMYMFVRQLQRRRGREKEKERERGGWRERGSAVLKMHDHAVS